MRIRFFTKGDRLLPSSRTRAHLVADYLRTQGFDAESFVVTSRPWWNLSPARWREFARNARLLWGLGRGDVAYVHKATDQLDFMALVLVRAWVLRRGFIFDFDDAIFLPTRRRAAKAWLMVRSADVVVVGSHYLAEYALRYNRNVHVLSAPIDVEGVYTPGSAHNAGPVRIGWTGTEGHYENMKLLIEPLRRLVAAGHDLAFVQLGGGEKIHELMRGVPGLGVEYTASLPWDNPRAVAKELQRFDIGVMPLQKIEWNRGKDGWKAKEYMGCGVATVLSDWGENPFIVRDGVDGLLAGDEESWYQALRRLVEDDGYRRMLGAAGRRRIEEEFSYAAFLPKLLSIIGAERADVKSEIHQAA